MAIAGPGHWPSAKDKGSELEQRVAAQLRDQGYSVETNVLVAGRSGGRHEVDVLASKRDGVLVFRVMVECKYLGEPVTKDVVAKTKLVRDDCAIDKAIIVSPAGFALGAHQQAAEHGIDLWEQPQLDSGPRIQDRTITGPGFVSRFSAHEARKWANSHRAGMLKREAVVGAATGHIECYLLAIDYTIESGSRVFKRVHSRREWKCFDAIENGFLYTFSDYPDLVTVSTRRVLPGKRSVRSLSKSLQDKFDRPRALTQEAAINRAREDLTVAGLNPDALSMTVASATPVLVPVMVGLLRSAKGERVVVKDGLLGESPKLSAILTRNVSAAMQFMAADEREPDSA